VIRCIASLLLLLLGTGTLTAQQRGLRVDRDVAIRMWLPAGDIEVRGWDRDSIDVRATSAAGSQFVGGGTAAAVKFAVEAKRPGDRALPAARVVMSVPRTARLWVKATTAVVTVSGLSGELDVLQVDGRTMLRDVGGVVTVESIDGSIALARASGVMRIRSGAATVDLAGITGSLDVSTVSGSVTWNGATIPATAIEARVVTVGGAVTLDGGLSPGSTLAIETHDGDVHLQLARDAATVVSATGGTQRIAAALADPRGKQSRITVRTFKGTVNAGVSSGI